MKFNDYLYFFSVTFGEPKVTKNSLTARTRSVSFLDFP